MTPAPLRARRRTRRARSDARPTDAAGLRSRRRHADGTDPGDGTAQPVRRAELSGVELPPLDQSTPAWPGRDVSVGGTTLNVRTTPATGAHPEPALYVHGLGGSATNWTDLAAQLSPWLAGEAIDLPGFGRSGPPADGDYSIRAHTRIVIDYLEQSGHSPVHLFGNSMGGAISIAVAARRPDLVRTLTLISPAVSDRRLQRLDDPRAALLLLPGLGPAVMRRLNSVPPEQRVAQVIRLCFADPSRQPANRMAEAVAEAEYRRQMRWAGDAFLRSIRGLIATYLASSRGGPRSMWTRMASITAPTLVVWGARDKLVNVRLAPQVAAAIPDARLLVLPDSGHVAQMEHPDTVARAVLALMDDAGVAVG